MTSGRLRADRILPAASAVARAAGTFAALAAALLFARTHLDGLLAAVARVSPMPGMRMDLVAWRTQPPTQWRSFCIVLALVGSAGLAHAILTRLARRWPVVVIAFDAALVALAWWMAATASPFLGRAFGAMLVPAAFLFAPFVSDVEPLRPPPSLRAPLRAALALQALALAWGVWITTFTHAAGFVVGAQVATWCFVVGRGSFRAREEDEALAGLPFTLLPIAGLLRQPGLGWVALAFAAYGATKLALRARASLVERVRRAPARVADAAIVTALWGFAAIFTLPYRFRDLPKINYDSHETTAFAPVGAILHGKLMMADAGLIYGPLRAYGLALYVMVAGITGEQIRAGQVVLNHVALLVMIALGWRLVERRVLAMAWFTWLLLVGTFVVVWINYSGYGTNAFGWADLGRIAWPTLAVVGGARAFVARAVRPLDRRSALVLAAWGGAGTLATLWAQEFGLCAVPALVVTPLVHHLVTPGPWRARAREAALAAASFAGGIVGTFALWVAVYGVFGKAGLFLHTVTYLVSAFAGGSYGAIVVPLKEATFLSPNALTAPTQYTGMPIEYATPPAVYFVTLVALAARALRGRWSGRDTITFAVLAFGAAAFRYGLGRSDFIHLLACSLPATLLAARLAVEAASAVHASRVATRVMRAGGFAAAAYVAYLSFSMTGVEWCLLPRWNAIVAGTERPSSGAPYTYPTMPRGGDVRISPETVALVDAIRANTTPKETIFQHVGNLDGGELYFFANRSNPTRFDLLGEFVTTADQRLAYEELQAAPPKLVVGEDWGITGDDVNRFLKERYHSIGKFGGFELFARNE